MSTAGQDLGRDRMMNAKESAAMDSMTSTIASRDEHSSDGGREEAALQEYLAALIQGNYAAPSPAGGGRIGELVRELGAKLVASQRTHADHVVQTAIEANEIGGLTARLIAPVREASESAQSMAAAVEELVASVREMTASSDSAAAGAEEAKQSVQDSITRVHEAISAFQDLAQRVQEAAADVEALGQASQEIGGIVKEIEKIASQTNLLALNATIEAARAGEAGKGFAVVANEVKNLSQQTAKATDDIRTRIEALLQQVDRIGDVMSAGAEVAESGRATVDTLGQQVESVGAQVDAVASRMGEVAGIIGQQSEAVGEIAQGVNAVAEMSRRNLDSINALADSTDRLDHAIADEMQDVAETEFRGKVIRLAKADHVIWKRRLIAMAAGRLALSADELADHHSCRLGRWYYSDASKRFGSHPAFRDLEDPHERVHRFGKEAARCFEQGRHEDALAAIAKMEEASQEVMRLLETLRVADEG
ncbi:MAG: chemotaxis protein [Alphaproteobacteria bacterium]|nr:MAG: chemotaxis protein [Alphaproteobacteria bacterium]